MLSDVRMFIPRAAAATRLHCRRLKTDDDKTMRVRRKPPRRQHAERPIHALKYEISRPRKPSKRLMMSAHQTS